jgi:glucose/arabinose dehydrogenase
VEPFASGFESPDFLTHAGDGTGTLYVVEQPGRIRTVTADGTVAPGAWLDISKRITYGGEQGLLGLAFHPQFRDNGRFYLDYSDIHGDQVISEFRRGADGLGDPTSERQLIFLKDFAPNHNGGMLAFGPDGDLYIGMGDGGGGGDPQHTGQDTNKLFGKLLRISVDPVGDRPYGIPPDNAFARGGGLPEIFDYGLRNPWRFSFDRPTGDLFIADVGQGAWEEIDVHHAGEASGLDFGWSLMEGPECFVTGCDRTGLTLPVAWYGHEGIDCSVTGGYVYRGTQWPALQGIYFYADYCSGIVRGLAADAAVAGPTQARDLLFSLQAVSSFGEDEAGELFLVSLGGSIFRVAGH